MFSKRKSGEVFEDLATEIEDELLYETFIDLNPEINKFENVSEENSNFGRNQ